MRDLQAQVRAYAEHLDAAAPELHQLDLERPVAVIRPAPPPGLRRRLAMGAVAAVVVVAAIGAAAVAFRSEPTDVAATTTLPQATTIPPPLMEAPARLVVVGDAPVLSRTEDDAFPFTGPGGVVAEDGTYHLFANRYGESGSQVVYATSVDLVRWSLEADGLLSSPELPYAEFGIQVRAAARLPDGRWGVFFDYEVAMGDDKFGSAIGVATATDPRGPWTVEREAVLDAEGSWRAGGVKQPTVVADGQQLVMYFVGVDDDGNGRIGRATSPDGVTWSPDSGPVLEAEQEWERGSLTRPNVVRGEEGWLMLYAARTASGHGFATSPDGIAWERAGTDAVLTTRDVVRPQIRDTELVIGPDGRILLLIENGGARTTSDMWLLEETS